LPSYWRRPFTRQSKACCRFLCVDEALQFRANLARSQILEKRYVFLDVAFECFIKRRLLLNLADGSPLPINIGRNCRGTVSYHPLEKIGIGRESFATRKNSAQSLARAPDQLSQERVCITIDIA